MKKCHIFPGHKYFVFYLCLFGCNPQAKGFYQICFCSGTAYSQFTGDLPLVMILSGILLLVPGGIGVQGVAAMLQDDVLSGMGFVFDMVVVGLSITLGLLVAKILLPSALLGTSRANANNKNTLPTQLEKDRADDAIASSGSDSDSEEDMAI
jgi:hypothetical protein